MWKPALMLRVLVAALSMLASPSISRAANVSRASVATGGAQALYGNSLGCSLSADGRFVAFVSSAQNLAPGLLTVGGDVYVHDRLTGTTERVSAPTGGTGGNNASDTPSISGDGRYVVFMSQATNLVSPPTPFGRNHVYLRDRQTGVTSLVSVTAAGTRGNGSSSAPAVSADGRWVAFVSNATNLVDPPANGQAQVFRWDRVTGAIVLASVDGAGVQGEQSSGHPSISADGSRIAFHSFAALEPRFGGQQIFLRDFAAGTTTLVSVSRTGLTAGNTHSANPAISADGHAVAFESWATDLLDDDPLGRWHVYVRDLAAATTVRASVDAAGGMADGSAYNAAISADGTRVVFETNAGNLVADGNGHVDIFVRKLDGPTWTERVSIPDAPLGDPEGNGWSWQPAISGDGSTIGFESWSSDLVSGDTNGFADVFAVSGYLPAWLGAPATAEAPGFTMRIAPLVARSGATVEVRYALPRDSHVRLVVRDIQGRSVRVLDDAPRAAGAHVARWDGRGGDGTRVGAGVFFFSVETPEQRRSGRVVVLH